MAIPTPSPDKLERISGERTFLRFIPLESQSKYVFVTGVDDAAGQLQFTVSDPGGANISYSAGDTIIVINSGYKEFNGYHVVSAYDSLAGTITVNTATPSNITFPVSFVEADEVHLINTNDLMTSGQSTDVSGGTSGGGSTDTWQTLGVEDEEITEASSGFNCSIELYTDNNVTVANVLGYVNVPSIIDIPEEFEPHVHIIMETYSSRDPMTATLLHATVYERVKWTNWQSKDAAGKTAFNTWSLTGDSPNKYVALPR